MAEEKCACGHPKHEGRCQEWRRYPEVLEARQCGCGMTREKPKYFSEGSE